MTVPGNIDALLLGGLGGYQIERSLRFNSPDSAYLNRTPASAGNRKTWTYSAWIKLTKLGTARGILAATAGTAISFGFTDQDKIFITISGVGVGSTTAVFRDPSAWYHIVIGFDTTQGPTADRVNLHVNGTRYFFSSTLVSLNTDYEINNNSAQQIGTTGVSGSTTYFDGYITEVNFVDGQVLNPSFFGETNPVTGVWGPKRYAGTYGTNGFYLKFADNSNTTAATLGKDSSGNGNNWTPNNFSVTAGVGNDSMIDVPTPYADGGNGRGNYCTGNPLYIPSTQSRMSLTNGNLEWGQAATNVNCSMAGTFTMRSGKWYWEVTVDRASNYSSIGMQTDVNTAWRGGGTVLYRSDGQKSIGGTASAYGASYTTNDVLGFAYDADAGTLTCYKNNTSQGTIYSSGTGNTWVPAIHDDNAGAGVTYYHKCNFGQRAFAYTPPTGFLALNTQNLPESSIKKPSSYMDALLYTGNATVRSITGLGFSPEFVWIKSRSAAIDHKLYDAVRGITKVLESSNTGAEGTDSGGLTAFNSDGFSLGTAAGQNQNGTTYVAWCWDESATPGFDIVTFTGNGSAPATISHSLGVAPKMMIVKNRDQTGDFVVYHSSITNSQTGGIFLNLTNAWSANSTYFNNSVPTSSNFQVGSYFTGNNIKYVAYLWSEVAGFSKFGSYTGNGSADGPFVHCGFRPRWILFKNSNVSGQYWDIYDTTRDTYNAAGLRLFPNASDAESDTRPEYDILSNGFKVRDATTSANGSGNTIIFAAFAESPFKYSLAR